MNSQLSIKIKEKYYYDPTSKTGLRYKKNNEEAGTLNNQGYWRVHVYKGLYRFNHRCIWYLLKGRHIREGFEVDHIDHNRGNNNIDNLKEVTHKENLQNRVAEPFKNNKLGIKNVYPITYKGNTVYRKKLADGTYKESKFLEKLL